MKVIELSFIIINVLSAAFCESRKLKFVTVKLDKPVEIILDIHISNIWIEKSKRLLQ